MQSREFSSVIAVLVAVFGTAACSSKSDSSQSMAPQGNESFSSRYNQSPPAQLNSSTATALPATTTTNASGQYGYQPFNEAANQSSMPSAYAQHPGGGGYTNAGAGAGADGDRHVRVDVPLVHVNVDRDTGGVHIDAPFVHINKPSRYDQSAVSIPDGRINQLR